MTLRRLDDLQRRRPALGFPWAVARKFFDDGGPREAALITYYGFLSLFPVLLLGVVAVSLVLSRRPELRQELVAAIVPPALQADIEASVAALSGSATALVLGVVWLVYAGIGVALSAYETLNHLAAVPVRDRAGVVATYLRAVAALGVLLAGSVAAGAVTVVAATVAALVAQWAVACGVLLVLARLLLCRRAPFAVLWPAAVIGAAGVTGLLNLGAVVLPSLARNAGWIYGGFATVAGVFTMLYVLSNVLVLAAEVAAVRHARLWPRALDPSRPTPADRHAMSLLLREQQRWPSGG